MRALRKRPATFADLEQVPETMTGQIIDGEVHVFPWPGLPHVLTTSHAGAGWRRERLPTLPREPFLILQRERPE